MLARTSAKLILWIIIHDGVTFKMFRVFCFLLFSSQLAATEVENEINKVFQCFTTKAEDISATISLGVIEIAPNETPEQAAKRVDLHLYEAKRGDRNTVFS